MVVVQFSRSPVHATASRSRALDRGVRRPWVSAEEVRPPHALLAARLPDARAACVRTGKGGKGFGGKGKGGGSWKQGPGKGMVPPGMDGKGMDGKGEAGRGRGPRHTATPVMLL